MKVGPRYRALREKLKLKQQAVADRIGQERQVVSRFETEGNDPKISTLQTFLGALGTSFAEFFESKIPLRFKDPSHQELHEKLQDILEAGGDYEQGIRLSLEAIHEKVIREARPKRAKAVGETGKNPA